MGLQKTAGRVGLRRARQQHRGFTMIELIAVIVILGVLAAIALPRFIDMRSNAEKAVIEGWVGALRSAQNLSYSASLVANAGYTSPQQMSLFNLVRCDNVAELGVGGGAPWQGHHLALASVREKVFKNSGDTACNDNVISFTSKSNRVVTITNGSTGVTWVASPAY